MSEFTINVKVDVSTRLETLLTTITSQLCSLGALRQEPPTRAEVELQADLRQVAQFEQAVQAVTQSKPSSTPVPTNQPAPEPEAKPISDADLRAAMDKARQKIEGEGFRNTEHPMYKKWHGRLNDWFKSQAAFFEAEKPTGIVGDDKRKSFIDVCDNIELQGESIVTAAAF